MNPLIPNITRVYGFAHSQLTLTKLRKIINVSIFALSLIYLVSKP